MAKERITVEPNRMPGLPRVRDTRVTISVVFGRVVVGASIESNTQVQPPKCTSGQWELQQREAAPRRELLAEAARCRASREASGSTRRIRGPEAQVQTQQVCLSELS
jgi:hypothetical protein